MMNEHKKGVKAVKYTTKPRNFVAKNATTAGAGAHKDKKKAAKQGEVKHKNKDYAEHLEQSLKLALSEGRHGYDSYGYSLAPGHDEGEPVYSRYHDVAGGGAPRNYSSANSQGGAYDVYIDGRRWKTFDTRSHASAVANKLIVKGKRAQIKAVSESFAKEDHGEFGKASFDTAISSKIQPSNHQQIGRKDPRSQIGEGEDAEGAMARTQLIGAAKQALELAGKLKSDTQLDSWVQSKITVGTNYIDTVYNFLMNGKQDVDK